MRSSLGSIQQLENGYYKVTATVGIDPKTGKQKRRSKRVHGSKREAEVELNKLIATGDVSTQSKTLNIVIDEYLENKKGKVRKPTLQEYERICQTIKTADFCGREIKDLETQEKIIKDWLAEFENDWGKKTAYKMLRQVFNYAKKRHYIRETPIDYLQEPKTKRTEIRTITSDELPIYLDAVRGSDIEAGVLVMLYMGLRRSEALARKWSDIDFEKETIFIYSTIRELRGGGIEFGETKTEKSKRKDYIPKPCLDRLREIKKDGWLCEYDGAVMKPDHFGRRWRALLKRANLPFVKIKNLRHSCGTILIREKGATISDVAELLGHSSTQTTENYYLQQSDKSKRRVASLWK